MCVCVCVAVCSLFPLLSLLTCSSLARRLLCWCSSSGGGSGSRCCLALSLALSLVSQARERLADQLPCSSIALSLSRSLSLLLPKRASERARERGCNHAAIHEPCRHVSLQGSARKQRARLRTRNSGNSLAALLFSLSLVRLAHSLARTHPSLPPCLPPSVSLSPSFV